MKLTGSARHSMPQGVPTFKSTSTLSIWHAPQFNFVPAHTDQTISSSYIELLPISYSAAALAFIHSHRNSIVNYFGPNIK